VYLQLLGMLQIAEAIPHCVQVVDDEDEPSLLLLEHYQDLPFREERDGSYYMGGVGEGLGLGTLFAQSFKRALDAYNILHWQVSTISTS
jgi:hypothetical protein